MIRRLVKLFNRHGPCRGITIYRFGRYTCELWFCPPRYQIEEHKHPNEDIELMFLAGDSLFISRSADKDITQKYYAISFKDTFKHFTVKAGDFHSFVVSNSWLVFLNFAKWRDGIKPTSAANDFKLKNNYGTRLS